MPDKEVVGEVEEPKLGVYVCHCGINIAFKVDVEKVVEAVSELPGVTIARTYSYMCSDPGQAQIQEDIEEHGLTRVVVAACSPRMHEPTFRAAVSDAGINAYQFDMANIREQCSWIHDDEAEATSKAIDLVRAAVARASHLTPLQEREVPVTRSALVIGGGIAGIQAALDIGNAGFKTYLVERDPSIGGRMAQLDKTFPTNDCSMCIGSPKLVEVGRHPDIEVMTRTEIAGISGEAGRFRLRLLHRYRAKPVRLSLQPAHQGRVRQPERLGRRADANALRSRGHDMGHDLLTKIGRVTPALRSSAAADSGHGVAQLGDRCS